MATLNDKVKAMFARFNKSTNLTSGERVALIHKGNYAFNQKQYDFAEKIFRTTNYHDGLVRVGNHHFKNENYFCAAEIYRLANYLKGEYQCYLKLGLVKDIPDFHNKTSFQKTHDSISEKMAKIVAIMLSVDNQPSSQEVNQK